MQTKSTFIFTIKYELMTVISYFFLLQSKYVVSRLTVFLVSDTKTVVQFIIR